MWTRIDKITRHMKGYKPPQIRIRFYASSGSWQGGLTAAATALIPEKWHRVNLYVDTETRRIAIQGCPDGLLSMCGGRRLCITQGMAVLGHVPHQFNASIRLEQVEGSPALVFDVPLEAGT